MMFVVSDSIQQGIQMRDELLKVSLALGTYHQGDNIIPVFNRIF